MLGTTGSISNWSTSSSAASVLTWVQSWGCGNDGIDGVFPFCHASDDTMCYDNGESRGLLRVGLSSQLTAALMMGTRTSKVLQRLEYDIENEGDFSQSWPLVRRECAKVEIPDSAIH